jgi:hypothetical protein
MTTETKLTAAGLPYRNACASTLHSAGLAAWRQDRVEDARAMFAAAWRADITTPSLQAAAAFWAARAELRLSGSDAATPWLHRAAERRRTFYGLLARRTLGLGMGFSRERVECCLAQCGGRVDEAAEMLLAARLSESPHRP